MSRVSFGFDAGQPSQDYRTQYESEPKNGPFSTNLPPQYLKQAETSSHWPTNDDFRMPFEALSDDAAARIIRHDYEIAANYRYQNHDWRWTIADTLYTGWKQTKFWEGTRIPRANVPVMVAFDQIESSMPRIMQGLFGEPDWFESVGMGHTSPKAARAVRDYMLAQLGDQRPREILRRVIKSALMYGNGIMMVCWDYQTKKTLQFAPQFVPRTRQVVNPIDNTIQMMRDSRQFDRRVIERVVEEYVNRPCWRYVPLKQFYVDPNCPSPVPCEGRYVCEESWMFVDELVALGETEGFESMPDRYTLMQLATQNMYTRADMTQSEQESARRAAWQPWIDQSSDPAARRIKVIRRYAADRITWSLNNRYVVYNKPNPIGRITYHDAFYADLLDRFYAMAVSDVVEPEQRVQEGLLNSRLDEISLGIHPSTVKQRGSGTPIYQVRVRPGAVAESSDPKNDVIRQYPMNVTQHAFLEAQASELRVQKHTGVTDLAMVGVGTATNPGARTAAGANLQGSAAASRAIYIVENIEDCVIGPALHDTHDYNQRFLDPDQMLDASQDDDSGAGVVLDPIQIFGAKVKFSMRAASRMQSRQALISLMPLTLQAMLNPNLISQLAAMGKTVDFTEMMQMFMDASGYRKKFNWIRDLSQQEVQAMQKPSQAETDLMIQRDRMTSLSQMQLNKQEMDIIKEIIKMKLERALGPGDTGGEE